MDETMTEPQQTVPFAPFEWMLSGRYLRARRREGFISVIAGFSFLGIMLGVATLIIVMAVMNGFRKELLDKILGLNGHLLVQPLESPLTDWKDVSERISQVQGIRLAAPVVGGQGLGSRRAAVEHRHPCPALQQPVDDGARAAPGAQHHGAGAREHHVGLQGAHGPH